MQLQQLCNLIKKGGDLAVFHNGEYAGIGNNNFSSFWFTLHLRDMVKVKMLKGETERPGTRVIVRVGTWLLFH